MRYYFGGLLIGGGVGLFVILLFLSYQEGKEEKEWRAFVEAYLMACEKNPNAEASVTK